MDRWPPPGPVTVGDDCRPLLRRHEPVAAADRRHLQVERRVTRMATIVHEILRRLMAAADLRENRGARVRALMMLAEVRAEPALAVVDLLHASSLASRLHS